MTPQQQADQYERTRAAHATEMAEDYVEAISDTIASSGTCRVTDLTERFGVTHVTVVKKLKRLRRAGLVQSEARGPVELTAAGQRLAARCKERHLIVFQFLRVIGVSAEGAAIDAEGIEHHVSEETLERFREAIRMGRI